MTRKILIVGGAGVFGSRLTTGILATTGFDVIVAGRDQARCEALIAWQDDATRARLSVAVIDTGTVTARDLVMTGAFVVVDAAGPYQGQKLRLPRAAIEARMHYLDFADGRDFVRGIAALDAAARSAGVAVLAGASSTPALTTAVLDELVAGWQQVDVVEATILPGNRAPRGRSVVRSILSYAGRPVSILLNGAWRSAPGWGLTRRLEIAGLGRRWTALCETPDLDLIPARFQVRRSALFQAGLQVSVLHLGLLAASFLVRTGLIRTLAPLASLARWAADLCGWAGTDRGAMVVDARGLDVDGRRVRSVWTMIVESGDGPCVPTLPALAAIKALADGRLTWRGAGPCVGLVPLEDIEAEIRRFRIVTRRQACHFEVEGSLFRTAVGPSFERLSKVVQAVHTPGWGATLLGQAQVDGPTSIVAAVVARVLNLPVSADKVPLRVDIDVDDTGERWARDFGGRCFVSWLTSNSAPGHITEQFGPFSFDVALSVTGKLLRWDVVSWRFGWIKLPRALMPVTFAEESEASDGCFQFDVSICLPLRLGQVVRYQGSLSTYNTKPTPRRVACHQAVGNMSLEPDYV